MYNPQEIYSAIKGYLLKLRKILENDTIFSFGDMKVVNKAKVDDILCCVEGSLPKEYKDYLKKYGSNKLKSNFFFQQLHIAIKNKFLFSTTNYAVRVAQANKMISSMISVLESDLDRVVREL